MNNKMKQKKELCKKFDELVQRKASVEREMFLFCDLMKYKIYTHLRDYIAQMHDTWSEDSKRLINLDELTFPITPFTLKEKTGQVIDRELNNYIQIKFKEWAKRILSIVEKDFERVKTELEYEIEPRSLSRTLVQQILLILSLGLKPKFLRFPTIIFTIVRLPRLFYIPQFLTGWQFGKEQLLKNLGNKLHESLPKYLSEKQDEIYQSIEEQFAQHARRITESLQKQIDETRRELETDIHTQK